MQHLFLVNPDFRAFEATRLERTFRSESGFNDLRAHRAEGPLLEAEFGEGDAFSRVELSEDATAITLSWISTTALSVALLIRRRLGEPLRMFDTQYAFDLLLSDETTLDELTAAIDAAQAHE